MNEYVQVTRVSELTRSFTLAQMPLLADAEEEDELKEVERGLPVTTVHPRVRVRERERERESGREREREKVGK